MNTFVTSKLGEVVEASQVWDLNFSSLTQWFWRSTKLLNNLTHVVECLVVYIAKLKFIILVVHQFMNKMTYHYSLVISMWCSRDGKKL